MKPADPLKLPLAGVSLVEASAGTGKTTALVRTYLRALLTTDLTVDKLLVVTFTRAATGELTTRIREQLAEAHVVLTGAAERTGFLAELLRRADADDELLLRRVRAAFTALDDSAVFTIHGFCQRMLADMAFETGGAFATEQRDEEQSLREEIAADFWRERQAKASPVYARWLLDTFGSPAGLLGKLHEALDVSGELRVDPIVTAKEVEQAERGFDDVARAAVDAWRKDADTLREWLLNGGDLRRNVYKYPSTSALLSEWNAWFETPVPSLPRDFNRLTREKVESSLKKGASLPDFDFFASDHGGALQEAVEALESAWWQEIFASALHYLQTELRNRKRRAREIGFDDMLRNLCDALAGAGGKALARRIAERFPLALVDEFQDTDPRQYEIFTRIYEKRKGVGLILIGDPKQAIYRFRGADVFTYMRARKKCEKDDRIFSLGENYRTNRALIGAINALFKRATRPFLYDQI
ncbi:MAG: UvrD-helicase domain-containing protein, partial [Gammaproteobacteria bacterium]